MKKLMGAHLVFSPTNPSGKRLLSVLITTTCLLGAVSGFAQEEKRPLFAEFNGTASVTNNGISLVPSFSLSEPALLFDLKFKNERFSIEPDVRFALEGKPWLFIFWFRYKAVQGNRFSLRVGAHPAMNFRTVNIVRNGQPPEDLLEARRYLAAGLAPNYKISDKVSIGMYYLHGQGFDEGVKQTNFLTLNAGFNELYLSDQFYLNLTPQIYYLRTDDLEGYYTAGFLTLAKKDFPLSFSAMCNIALDTEIAPEDDFIWSLSLVYRFP